MQYHKKLTLTAGETTEIDFRAPRFAFFDPSVALGVSGCKSASELLITVLGVEVADGGPCSTLLTAAGDTIFPESLVISSLSIKDFLRSFFRALFEFFPHFLSVDLAQINFLQSSLTKISFFLK